MNHRTASELLVDLELGSLPNHRERAVADHVGGCEACRRWLSTYRLLASGLGRTDLREESHPSSDLLALWTLHPAELEAAPEHALEGHLRRCPTCRTEVELVRVAVGASRPATPGAREAVASGRSSARRRLVLAAGLGALTFGLGAFGHAFWRGEGSAERISAPAGAQAESQRPTIRRARLSGVELEGHRLLETEGAMSVRDVKITPGASVTLRAGESIAIENGFEIAAGARATLSTTPSSSRGDTEP